MNVLSIVIPVHAEKTIEDLCLMLMSFLAAEYVLEIVLINDYSRAGTDAVCKRLQSTFPETITNVLLSRNFGEHSAVMAGLNQSRGDYVVVMADDFQNPPEEVHGLVAEILKGFDVVYSQYPEKQDNTFRNLVSFLNGSMARVIMNKPAYLYLSSFKVMNRFLVNQVIMYKTTNPYLDAIILRITRNIGTHAVRHDRRRAARSGDTMQKLAAHWGNMIVSYSLFPLRILVVAGFILILLGLYSVANMLIRDMLPLLENLSDLEEFTSVAMFFRGLQILAIGILGEYVGRIYLMLNHEPQFIIREICPTHTELIY